MNKYRRSLDKFFSKGSFGQRIVPIITVSFFLLLQTEMSAQNDWQLLGLEEYAVEYVYAKGDTIWTSVRDTNYNGSVYFSFNSGNTWIKIDDSDTLINGHLMLLEVSPYDISTIYGYSYEGRGIKSTDGGESWENMFSFLEPWPNTRRVRKIYVSPFNKDVIFSIITNSSWASLVRTTDGGENWEDVSAFAFSSHGSQITFAFDPIDSTTIYVAGDDQMAHTAFYPSYDLGESWYFLPNSISTNWIIVDWANNNRIYLFAYPMRSEDGGQTWMYIVDGLPMTSRIFSIINPHDSSVLYTSTKEGIYKTTNRGEQWELIEGSENLNFQFSINYPEHLFIDSFTNKLYVGTKQGLYKYDLITSVEEEKENIPGEFILHQNYPNPFNPTTTIKYQITNDKSQINSSPQDAAHNTKIQTLLVVYDILGKEVATLVNEEQSPGSYIVTFTASNLPSGIYLYRLTAGQVSIVRKMLLLK